MSTPETNHQFTGIWNREHLDEKVLNIANSMAEENGPVGQNNVKKKPKHWGILAVVLNLVVFLLSTLAITPLMLAFADPGSDGFFSPDEILEQLTSPVALLVSSGLMYTVWLGGMWFTTRFLGQKSWKKDFKFSFKKKDPLIGLAIAAGLYATLFVVQLALSALGFNLEEADNGSTISNQQGIWFVVIAIGIASILGPFSEEMFFRGFVLNAVINTFQRPKKKADELGLQKETNKVSVWFADTLNKIALPAAVILSSALFGIFHFQTATPGGWFLVVVTGTLGSVFAIVTLKTGRLGPAIFGHMFYNFATLMIAQIFS